MTVVLVLVAVGAVLGGTLALGIWIGRAVAEDQAAEAAARRQLAGLEARPRPMLPGVVDRPDYHPADSIGPGRLPGYAEPFPRPGRFDVPAAGMTAPDLEPSRPPTSPDDLEAEVGRIIHDSELYVAALIARIRHTERKYLA